MVRLTHKKSCSDRNSQCLGAKARWFGSSSVQMKTPSNQSQFRYYEKRVVVFPNSIYHKYNLHMRLCTWKIFNIYPNQQQRKIKKNKKYCYCYFSRLDTTYFPPQAGVGGVPCRLEKCGLMWAYNVIINEIKNKINK